MPARFGGVGVWHARRNSTVFLRSRDRGSEGAVVFPEIGGDGCFDHKGYRTPIADSSTFKRSPMAIVCTQGRIEIIDMQSRIPLLMEFPGIMRVAVNVFIYCCKALPLRQPIKGLDMVAVNRSEVHEYQFDIKMPDGVVTRGLKVLASNRSAALNELRKMRPSCMVLAKMAPTSEEQRQIPKFLFKHQP